ncbi:MAG: hypothetical protein ABIN89_21415 [Chitinophagaceae bacterium]
MFTSKQHLHFNLGVDADIAAFFVNRQVPVNNHYWNKKLLYVADGTGYLFIPLFFDLQFKSGISRDNILNEEYVGLMEVILDSAALHEMEKICFSQHVENCKNIMSNKIKNHNLYIDLLLYFRDQQLKPYKKLGTTSKALNRGDTFLFSTCFLDLDNEVTNKNLENWYALVPAFLLMDDISDIQEDQEKNEENAVNDFGPGNTGVKNAIEFLRNKFSHLKTLNAALGSYFERSLEKKLQTAYMKSLLNN